MGPHAVRLARCRTAPPARSCPARPKPVRARSAARDRTKVLKTPRAVSCRPVSSPVPGSAFVFQPTRHDLLPRASELNPNRRPGPEWNIPLPHVKTPILSKPVGALWRMLGRLLGMLVV